MQLYTQQYNNILRQSSIFSKYIFNLENSSYKIYTDNQILVGFKLFSSKYNQILKLEKFKFPPNIIYRYMKREIQIYNFYQIIFLNINQIYYNIPLKNVQKNRIITLISYHDNIR